MRQEMVTILTADEVDKLVHQHYGLKSFNFRAAAEVGNDTWISFKLSPPEPTNEAEWTLALSRKGGPGTYDVLQKLYDEGHIPDSSNRVFVDCSW